MFIPGPIAPTGGKEVVLTSFFDFRGDGTLDIFVASKDHDLLTMQAFENIAESDVTFLMVQVNFWIIFQSLELQISFVIFNLGNNSH